MSYRRAFSTLGCPQATLGECVALAARFGLEGVELRALGGTVQLPRYLAETYGSPEALAEKRERERSGEGGAVAIVALDTSFRLADSGAADRDALVEYVPWAEALGVRWLRVFDGGRAADATEFAHAADNLRWWRRERERNRWSVQWMVETHDSLFTAATLTRFCEAEPDIGILWDSHHTWKKGGEDPMVTWSAIAPRVVHVHVKDSVSVPSARHPYTYTLPGTGEFPATPLLAALRRDFRGVVSLEWEKLWLPELPDLEPALASARDHGWM